MYSKLAAESRKALIAQAKRLTREERLKAFVRHNQLVAQLYNAARQVRMKRQRQGDTPESQHSADSPLKRRR